MSWDIKFNPVMIVHLLLLISVFWLSVVLLLIVFKKDLFLKTWREPYFLQPYLALESDDWGPGGEEVAGGLRAMTSVLEKFKDASGNCVRVTANIILASPKPGSEGTESSGTVLKVLKVDYPEIYQAILSSWKRHLLMPQLHGLVHLNIAGFHKKEEGFLTENIADLDNFDELPHNLQAHYVDGTSLPSKEMSFQQQRELVLEAARIFHDHFGFYSRSTVAPCYLWNDDTEKAWKEAGVEYIQTGGYRCGSLNESGGYIQDKPIIRFGDRNSLDQIYLVRTAMFEPRDRSDAEQVCTEGIRKAIRQGLPAVVSTHRYNFCSDDHVSGIALAGLEAVLSRALRDYPGLLFTDSVELGRMIQEAGSCRIPRLARFRMMVFRIWDRHPKVRIIGVLSFIIIPVFLIILASLFLDRICDTALKNNEVKKGA